eukprot:jgi/Ulvmu1/10078/UM006_0025.1
MVQAAIDPYQAATPSEPHRHRGGARPAKLASNSSPPDTKPGRLVKRSRTRKRDDCDGRAPASVPDVVDTVAVTAVHVTAKKTSKTKKKKKRVSIVDEVPPSPVQETAAFDTSHAAAGRTSADIGHGGVWQSSAQADDEPEVPKKKKKKKKKRKLTSPEITDPAELGVPAHNTDVCDAEVAEAVARSTAVTPVEASEARKRGSHCWGCRPTCTPDRRRLWGSCSPREEEKEEEETKEARRSYRW